MTLPTQAPTGISHIIGIRIVYLTSDLLYLELPEKKSDERPESIEVLGCYEAMYYAKPYTITSHIE